MKPGYTKKGIRKIKIICLVVMLQFCAVGKQEAA
jgi:hypothetical protein